MLKKTLIILLFMLGCSSEIGAICSYRLFKAPNGKLVLILGDHHCDAYTEHLKSFVETIKLTKLAQPLEMLVELPEKIDIDDSVFLVPSFQLVLDLMQLKSPEITSRFTFTHCDPRGYAGGRVEAVYQEMVDTARQVVSDEAAKEFYNLERVGRRGEPASKDWQEVRATQSALITQEVETLASFIRMEDTLAGLLAVYENNHKSMLSLLKKYEAQKEIQALIKEHYVEPFRESLEVIKVRFGRYLKTFHMPVTIDLLMKGLFYHQETIADLLSFLEVWHALYLETTDYLFASMYMLDAVLSRSTKDTPICVYVGEVHAVHMTETLQNIDGWECIEEAVLFKGLSAYLGTNNEVPTFQEDLLRVLKTCLKPLQVRCCKVCKENPKKLQRCGDCKAVTYCGSVCQRADWKKHKRICKKIKVKV